MYDITENKRDLHFLTNVETNSRIEGGEMHMDTMCDIRNGVTRCINEEDYTYDVLELHQDKQMVEVSKNDVMAMAKHFGIVE